MVIFIITAAAGILVAIAELIHFGRCRKVARLAFGPGGIPSPVGMIAPVLRIAAFAAVAWGLSTLYGVEPRVHRASELKPHEIKHVVLVLDVSPSMRLDDAGPTRQLSRLTRAAEIMESFFERVPLEEFRISVVAVYNGAKPVVIDTKDVEVVRNILNDLPMHYAFTAGKTDLLSGLEEAARIAKPWRPQSTTVMMVTDGDTIPATGMPKMPASVRDVVVVGVGDPRTGKFIDGRQSRQDTSTLRQIATRLRGTYHNGNEKHLSTELLNDLSNAKNEDPFDRLSKREYALIAIAVGSSTLALLPLLLHFAGSFWLPGIRRPRTAKSLPTTPQVPARRFGES